MVPATMRLYAPAKINFFLHVLGKRADGYHDLETWMQKLDLYDVIDLELFSGEGIDFSCVDAAVPCDDSNLVVKAARAFLSKSKRSYGFGLRIRLEKQIPVAAGLGGGSSDAGTILRGLNAFFGVEFSPGELIDMARPLGADVPFFAVEHNAVLATGIGDIMYPVDSVSDCLFLLVNPDVFVSTSWVFENLSLTRTSKTSKLSCFQKCKEGSLSLQDLHNDLEQVTSARYPQIEDIKKSLRKAGASNVLMSGSGPTVFGVFPDNGRLLDTDIQRIVDMLRQEYGGKVYLSRANTDKR